MSHESVTTFIVTIFNISKPNKAQIKDGIIEISHNNERYSFNLNEIMLPQSCSFYSDSINTIQINFSKYNCCVDIPFELYFTDSIINEFVMHNNTIHTHDNIDNKNNKNNTNIIDLIPPIITLSITSCIPLPYIIIDNNNSNKHMYNYLNNNVPSPIFEFNICSNTLQYQIFDLISKFIDNSHHDNNIKIWEQIKKYIKHPSHRHITLIAVFHKLNTINNTNNIIQKNNKYIVSSNTYKLLYQLLRQVLHYANPHNNKININNQSMDILTFYLVLCIGQITYYQHKNHLNCLIDNLGYQSWMNIDAMYQLTHYLMSQNTNINTDNIQDKLTYLKIILSFILIQQTENAHLSNKVNKLDTLYSKLNLMNDIIQKLPLYNESKQYLFTWLIKPISNLLLTIDTQTNNKSLKLTKMLSSSDLKNYNNNCNNNSPFGYLYNNRVLDTSYNCVFDTYYQYIDSIQSISKITPKLRSEQTPNDNNIAQIDLTHSTISEPILKHCISNYAVLPPSTPSIPTIPSINNINEEFCLLEQMAEQINNGIDSGNSMILSFETMNYLKEEAGERENKSKLTDGIVLVIPGIPLLNGFIKLTNYRVLFIPFKKQCMQYKTYKNYFEIPLGSIYNTILNNIEINHNLNGLNQQLLSFNKIEKQNIFIYKYLLDIITKDGRNIKLLFANIKQNNLNKFINELKQNAFTNDIQQSFAFHATKHSVEIDGWNVYDFFEEFTRQKVPLLFEKNNNNNNISNNKWRISKINKSYNYCETYPSYFIVPASISDSDLEEIKSLNSSSSPFRSKARIPVLTYYHSNGSVIMRSSQPMTGMGGLGGFVSTSWWSQNTCKADENLLRDSNIKYIIDARPKMNAVVNQAAGGGYENTVDVYKGIRLIFGNIHNIHQVRQSFDNIIKAITTCIGRHNHCLHIPHIKYLYIGHKYDRKEEEEKEEDDDLNQTSLMCDDFGVISSNQPLYDMEHINDEFNSNSNDTHTHKRVTSSSSAGDLWKMGIKSVTKHAKSVIKNGTNKNENKNGNNTCMEASKSENEKKEPENKESNNANNDLYDMILRDDTFWDLIIGSSWFTYLRSIIVTSICIVSMIDTECASVLIHCSDGWDRTSQLCCLSQILLDPFYRSIGGLCILIEKDWISFGHKFKERFGHMKNDISNDQRSPIFIQFLDCLYQIISQCPNQFEYNNNLLQYIAYHTTSCLYGTFLCDSQKERLVKYKLNKNTNSIWNKILNDKEFINENKFKNINYKPCNSVLYLDHRSINLTLWNYYTKIDPFPSYNNTPNTPQQSVNNNNKNLNENHIISKQKDLQIKRLKNKVNELEKIKLKYEQIMKCIDTKNGFLLQNQIPIIPDLDYVSSLNNTTQNSDESSTSNS